jgi:UDP-3-O-[3-hydroxymyristoyl] glucosamine N-acyltransferase
MIPLARQTLSELAAKAAARLAEDLALLGGGQAPFIKALEGQTEVYGLSSAEEAAPGAICFATSAAYLAKAKAGGAAALVVAPDLEGSLAGCPALVTQDPRLAFAAILSIAKESLIPPLPQGEPFFLDRSSCRIGQGATFGPRSYVGARVAIGDGVVVGPDVFLENDAEIGAGTILHPKVVIRWGCRVGKNCQIHAGAVIGEDGFGYVQVPCPKTGRLIHYKNPHLGRAILGDDVEVGANTTIDRGLVADTVIGRGTKIDNLVQIGHNCRLGRDVIAVAQTGFGGHSQVGDRVFVLGQAGLSHGAIVGEDAIITGQTGVTGKVPAGRTAWSGTPKKPMSQDLKSQAMVARDLPRFRRFWREFRKSPSFEALKTALSEEE